MEMTQIDIDNMPPDEVRRLSEKVLEQIKSMNDADLRVVARTRDSLIYFIAELAKAFAAALGFIIALPIAWAIRIANSIGEGFKTVGAIVTSQPRAASVSPTRRERLPADGESDSA
jgi:hypothetical protein